MIGRSDLDPQRAVPLLAAAGIGEPVESVTRLEGGVNSDVFDVRAGERCVVVKIYPDVARSNLAQEVAVYELLARRAPDLPVPRVLAAGDLFAVYTRLPGGNLRSLLGRLDDAELATVNRQIGAVLRALHEVELDRFGPIGEHGPRSNVAYMRDRFEVRLRDFAQLGGEPRLRRKLERAAAAGADVLERCERPVFCHNDGHDANVLVDRSPGGWSVSGLLDFEHALGGDPVLDLAKTYCHSEHRSEPMLASLVEGYGGLDAGWRDAFELYLLFHRLELWVLLASLGVTDRLPSVAEELERAT